MNNTPAPGVPPAMARSAAVPAAAPGAAARRQEPRRLRGAAPEPVTATAQQSRPRPAATAGTHHGADQETPAPPGPPTRPSSTVEQTQQVFHELHPDGRHALCALCDSQYRAA